MIGLDASIVIFSSVVTTSKSIREYILNDITAMDYEIIRFTLTCSEKTLIERHKGRGDGGEVSFYFLNLEPYPNDYIINTDNKTVTEIVNEIRSIIDSANLTSS